MVLLAEDIYNMYIDKTEDPEEVCGDTTHVDRKVLGIEVYTTVKICADVGCKDFASFSAKVDTGAGGNVLPQLIQCFT